MPETMKTPAPVTSGKRGAGASQTPKPAPFADPPEEAVAAARYWMAEMWPELTPTARAAMALNSPSSWTDEHRSGWAELRGFAPDCGPFLGLGEGPEATGKVLDSLARAAVAASDSADVFASPYPHRATGRRKGQAAYRRHVHADLDGPVDWEVLHALGAIVVASGGVTESGDQKVHAYLRLSETVSPPEHEVLCEAFGRLVGPDSWDSSKHSDEDLLRVPGTMNRKDPAHPRPVEWVVPPSHASVKTWPPQALAVVLDVRWPIPPADDGPTFAPRSGRARSDRNAVGTGSAAYRRLVDRLRQRGPVWERAGQVRACCPGPNHSNGNTRSPALSVGDAGDCALVYCHVGCEPGDVLAALGLTMADLYDDAPRRDHETACEEPHSMFRWEPEKARL